MEISGPDRPGRAPSGPGGRRERFGRAGLGCGLVAVAIALLPGWIAPHYDPPSKPIHRQAADWLGQLKDQAAAAVGGEEPPAAVPAPPNPWRDPRIALAAQVLALGALGCAALAFARREDGRLVACAVALGAGAIASEHLLTAVLIVVFAVTAALLAGLARHA